MSAMLRILDEDALELLVDYTYNPRMSTSRDVVLVGAHFFSTCRRMHALLPPALLRLGALRARFWADVAPAREAWFARVVDEVLARQHTGGAVVNNSTLRLDGLTITAREVYVPFVDTTSLGVTASSVLGEAVDRLAEQEHSWTPPGPHVAPEYLARFFADVRSTLVQRLSILCNNARDPNGGNTPHALFAQQRARKRRRL
ncbi:MAG: hypothetical protein WCP53_00105 [Verrucomicrobiota bacterium]